LSRIYNCKNMVHLVKLYINYCLYTSMKKINQYIVPVLVIVMAIALVITMFSTLIYQYKRSREDLVELSSKHAGIVLHTVIVGIQTTAGIRKHLHNENVATNVIVKVLKEYGTGALIQKFERSGSIYYIVCQDENEIIAATKGISELNSVWSDIFLSDAFENEKLAHRNLPGKKYHFETVNTFKVNHEKYLLRVCFKIRSIRRLELHLIRRLALQGFVFIFIVLILVLYFINIHSNRLLAREHDKMMAEVERIQQQLRQQERTAAMGQLAAGVAHEVRNPLNAIQILIQRMVREVEPGEESAQKFTQFTRIIQEEIKRLNDIIKQFNDFSSAKHPEFKECNPVNIARDIVLLESGVARQKNINIKLEAQEKPVLIKADSHFLKQALVNVIKNAIEATPDNGEIIVSVSQSNKTTDFIVEDSGVGMNEEEREKAFNLYFSTKSQGIGLGLAITRRIIDQHDGEILVRTEDGKGTVITLRIPNVLKE